MHIAFSTYVKYSDTYSPKGGALDLGVLPAKDVNQRPIVTREQRPNLSS
jgi:hypothetical protein